jgi:SAM-dependent methyltransferase
MTLVSRIHGDYVYQRRVRRLVHHLSGLVPVGASVLDVGCGDGLISRAVMDRRPDVSIRGIDVLLRQGAHIPVERFNGEEIPAASGSYDYVMFVDVLHHVEDPIVLLSEAVRVARKGIVIKDHTKDGLLAGPTLRFMDWLGNSRYGVALPYNYWPRERWHGAITALGLSIAEWHSDLDLYPWPTDYLFGRSLHFAARLDLRREADRSN